jgi:hypothetical protein
MQGVIVIEAPEGRKNPLVKAFLSPLRGWSLLAADNPGLTPWAIHLRPCGATQAVFIDVLRSERSRVYLLVGRS